ncbi:MAG: hypothetical protein IKP00_13360 [Victivallales bacterium]|nr:hypothetical protein [Victivallales bacterium]
MNKHLISIFLASLASLLIPKAISQEILPIYYKQDPGIVIDGKLSQDDWGDIQSVILFDSTHGNRGTRPNQEWKSDADLSGSVKLAYRNDALYIGAKVVDDIHEQQLIGVNSWRGDHIELVLDFEPASDTMRTKFGEKQFQVILSPGSLDGKIAAEAYMMRPVKRPLKIKIASVKTADGYILEAEIPWTELGFKDKSPERQLVGLDVMLSDTDAVGDGQEKYMFAGQAPFELKRGRLMMAYLSDPRGYVPDNLMTSGKQVLMREPVKLEEGNHPFKLEFDYQPEAGLTTVLGFTAFAPVKRNFAGHSNLLKVLVNGKPLKGEHLFNKSNKAVLKDGKPFVYVNTLNEIRLPYLNKIEGNPVATKTWNTFRDAQDWPHFEFELTDMLKPGKNVVVFDIYFPKRDIQYRPVMLSDVFIYKTSMKTKNKKPAPTGELPVITPQPVGKVPFELERLSDSSIKITLNGDTYLVNSRWSIPEGKYVTGENAYFTRKRELVHKDELLVIRDTISNKMQQELPVMHFHEITAKNESEFFLNGFAIPKEMREFQAGVNNSTYVKNAKSGLGLFPLDDIFRIHGENFIAAEDKAGIADRKLVVPPGKSQVVELAVIPTSQADYYAFINALRRELEVNFTVQGSYCFPRAGWYALHYWLYEKDRNKSVQGLRDYITYTDSRYAEVYGSFMGTHPTADGWGRKGHPSEYIEKNRELYERLLSFVLEAVPGVHTAVYYHCFLDTWPESKELFKEDAIINSYGAHQHYLDPKPDVKSVYMLYLPTLQNEFGKACSKMIDEIMQFHCPQNAAFYWDEFKSSKIGYTYNPNVWDGCSGEIDDKTFELKRRMTSVAYASRDFRLAMVRKIKATGREVVVNGIPITRDIMKENLIAFTETAQISNCLKNHIYTPVQLGNHKLSSEDAARSEVIYHQMLEGLDYGMLYYYYQIQYLPDHHTLTQYMFPLTPMELHCGYIIGKEKIVTKLSGLYGWNDASALTAFVYDDKGWPVPDFKAPTKLENGRSFIELRLPEDWSAIILRK